MPIHQVQHCQRELDDSISSSLNFLRVGQTFKVLQPSGTYKTIDARTSELLAGVALLRICLAWEEFLESVFLRYMCGARSGNGFTPILLQAREQSISSAMARLLASGGRFLNWSSRYTRNRAVTYFGRGEPFAKAITSGGTVLEEIFIVRNRFAHRSEFAANEFRTVVTSRIGYVPRGMTAGRFLLANNPATGQTFVEYYANILLGVSLIITPR